MTTMRSVSLLERLRADKGVTLNQAAIDCRMGLKTLRKYERDAVPYPHPDTLKRLAAYYGVTAAEILEDLRNRAISEPEREAA